MVNALLILPNRTERRVLGKQPRGPPGAPGEAAPTKADLWRSPEHQHRQLIAANGIVVAASLGANRHQHTDTDVSANTARRKGGGCLHPCQGGGQEAASDTCYGSNGSLYCDQQTTSVAPATVRSRCGFLMQWKLREIVQPTAAQSWCFPVEMVTGAFPRVYLPE